MQENIMSAWAQALEMLQEEISLIGYKTYVEVMVPRLVDDTTICLLAPSNYHIDVCKRKYMDLIENTLAVITKKKYIITFEAKDIISDDILDESETKIKKDLELVNNAVKKKVPQEESNTTNNQIKSNLNPKYIFENYVVGSNNRFAHAAAVAVCEAPGTKYNPLYIYGGVGLGKTHLMQSIGNGITKNCPDLKVLCTTGELFANELISSIMNDKNQEFRDKYRNIDVLLIDDIQFLAGKEKCQEEFFHTFNSLFQSEKQIILTSEKAPKELLLEERLKTRFEMGLAVDIQSPDYETRLAILRKKTELERYVIDDEVLIKIASKVKSNIRELEGVFNKLMAYSSFTNADLTDQIVDTTIESILVKSSKVLTSKLIMQIVGKFFNIKVSDMISSKKSNNITYPRQIAMYLCREVANLSFPAIGKDFGGRDHSTVLYAYGKIQDEYDSNEETKNIIEEIKKSLTIED